MKNHRQFLPLFRIFAIAGILISNSLVDARAQDSEPNPYRKTTLHGGLGFAGIYGTAFINLERMLTQSLDKKVTGTFGKVGYGTYGAWGDSGQYFNLQYGIITGRKASHFEMSAGPNFVVNGDMDFPIAFNFAYRHQKPGKPFLFRTGFGFPESLFFAMGLSF
ncbi:hypothetical protein [Algoriphagus mannitolivorans]|uniref:hypothetical protein n=1 Tax=Algoriphagus mannitolivorans TaxID=226504 RepID=UPI0004240EB8|nr:hypothetical protein [Algoriphagus mannitolivorans]